jgi:hypothetical protein
MRGILFCFPFEVEELSFRMFSALFRIGFLWKTMSAMPGFLSSGVILRNYAGCGCGEMVFS